DLLLRAGHVPAGRQVRRGGQEEDRGGAAPPPESRRFLARDPPPRGRGGRRLLHRPLHPRPGGQIPLPPDLPAVTDRNWRTLPMATLALMAVLLFAQDEDPAQKTVTLKKGDKGL